MATPKRLKRFFGNESRNKKESEYKLGLSLQGGGSYGSFMHGAIKALLEEGLEVHEITGTSAGSITASLLSYGLNTGGPSKAIQLLDDFWDDMKEEGAVFAKLLRTFNPLSIGMGTYPNLGRVFKYATSLVPEGLILNRLKNSFSKYIKDWDKVGTEDLPVHVNATRVDPETGERSHAIFSNKEIGPDQVLASCSLHELGATKIDGVKHYDGGYWQNPATDPLEQNEDITDLFFINIQPKPDAPLKAEHQDDARNNTHDNPGHEIMGEEIFNHIEHLRQTRPDLNIHVISLDVHPDWDATSRVNTDPRWLQELEDMGYEAGKKWAKQHMQKLGKQSSYAPEEQVKPPRKQAKPK